MLRRILSILAIGFLAVLVQGTLLKGLFPQLVVPGLVLILVLYLAFYETNIFGTFLVFGLGLLLDMCGGILIGPWAGSFVFVYGVTAFISQRIFAESFVALVVTSFVASLVSNFIYAALTVQVMHSHFNQYWIFLVEALLTAVVCPFIFSFLKIVLQSREVRSARKYSLMRS